MELVSYVNDVAQPVSQVLMTCDANGNYKAAYAYGLERTKVDFLDNSRPESQDPLYYLYDGLGSVGQLMTPSGNVRARYNYDPFGVPLTGGQLPADNKNVLYNSFGYTGEQHDHETDFIYLRARYYDPAVGRFLNKDTYPGQLTDPLSQHLYVYCKANPLNHIDPSGHWNEKVHKDLTIRWAREAGFSNEEAKVIADACNNVDFARETNPLFHQDWHFDRSSYDNTTMDTRLIHKMEEYNQAIPLLRNPETRTEGLRHLGKGLHPLQDIDAHMNAGIYSDPILSYHDLPWLKKLLWKEDFYDDIDFDFRNGKFEYVGSEYNHRLWNTKQNTIDYLKMALYSSGGCLRQ